jgi:hypothetical protein
MGTVFDVKIVAIRNSNPFVASISDRFIQIVIHPMKETDASITAKKDELLQSQIQFAASTNSHLLPHNIYFLRVIALYLCPTIGPIAATRSSAAYQMEIRGDYVRRGCFLDNVSTAFL